uniref:Reverse transcriptase n=1 Tax=Cannabis sativa TaxID=3483 RepID=A0A803PTE2_CANSA
MDASASISEGNPPIEDPSIQGEEGQGTNMVTLQEVTEFGEPGIDAGEMDEMRTVIARRGFLKFQVDILLNQRLVVGFHLNISRDRKEWEYAYPPIGKAVPLYGAWIKVGVPIRNCFDPAILRLKVDENLRRAEDSSPVEAREKGKSGAKKACLDVQRKLARSGNLSQQRQRPSPRSRRHPMTSIDNRRRDEGIVASLMADIGPTRDQMVDIPHEEIYNTSFSGAKERRASVTVVHVITLGEDVKTLGEKTPSTLVAMLPPVEINTFSQAAVAVMGLATSEEIILRDEGETRADLVKEQSRELKAVRSEIAWTRWKIRTQVRVLLIWKAIWLTLLYMRLSIWYRVRRQPLASPLRRHEDPFVELSGIDMKVLEASGGLFEVLIKEPMTRLKWYMFDVYGRPYDNEKKCFWDRLEEKINRERPDRGMVLGDWITIFAAAKVSHSPITISDHGYILMDSNAGRQRGVKPFRFFEAWAREQSCEETIKQAWCVRGRMSGRLCGRLSDTRQALQNWKKGAFGDCEILIKEAKERLGWIQTQPVLDSLLQEEAVLQVRISELWIRKESMWRQKSREIWLKVGDKNSKFFHTSTVIRRRRNEINAVKNKLGGWETKAHKIGTVFNEFFRDLYSSEGTVLDEAFYDLLSPLVTMEENTMLKAIPSPDEVWNVVAAMHPLMALGPDGMPGFFYRRYWEIVGTDVLHMVQNFFTTRILEKQLSYTFICLIPKEENTCTVDKFRPISLCNFAYKIISKINATRMRGVLKGNDFDSGVCALIMECVRTVSPFPFLLCHDVLSKLILRQQIRGQIQGISISRSAPVVSHLMFADDTILFARANVRVATNILDCIHKYESWSGQKCSLGKSSVLFSSNMGSTHKNNILDILNVKECDGQEKHLGNPFVFKRKKREDYLYLKQKVLKRIEGWKTKLLSFTGRTTLVKSVALSIPLYAMSTNKLPVSSCREIDRMIRKFRWTGTTEKDRYLALVGWDHLCKPTVNGGLGFRKLEDMNKILLAKLAWQFASSFDRPWVSCFSKKYCKRESFWSINARGSDSAFWKGILNARDLLRKGSMTMVGKGDSVDVWTQPWIPWLDYGEFIELMNQVKPRYPHINSVADNSNPNGSWNIELLKEMFGDVLGERIGTINRIPQDNSDLVVWKEASDGRFTVKRGYNATLGGVSLEDGNLWKKVWGKKVHYSHSVMIWRAVMGCVPTRDRLDFVGDKSCPLCDGSSESALHIFWECHCARALWFSSPFPLCYGAGFGNSVKERTPAVADGRVLCNSNDVFCVSDASWKESNAGLAVGLLDRRNHESFWYAKYDQASSAAETELLAIKWALHLAEQKGFYSFAGASDAKVLINALNDQKCPPMWKLRPLAMEVLNLCNRFSVCNFYYISRKDNTACDALARWARGNMHCNGYINREGSPVVIPNYLLQ